MKLKHSLHGILRTALLALVAISACAQVGPSNGDTWKEEVLLHDGQKIIVERSQTYGGRREVGQSPPVKEHSISFVLPGSGKSFTWTSEYGEDLGRSNFNLLALHIKQGTPYLVAKPNLCLSYNKWGRPNPPYVIFKHENDGWKRIPLNELPLEFENINLVIDNLGDADTLATQQMVTAELIKKLNGELRQPEYKKILREPLSKQKIVEMCGDRVFYKGRWIVDSPTARAIVDFNQK